MQQTPIYKLNQYEPEDNFLRTDFNEDNQKVETAIQGVDGAVKTVEGRVTALEGKTGTTDGSVNSLTGRMSAVEGRVNNLDGQVAALGTQKIGQGELNSAIQANNVKYDQEIQGIKGSVSALDGKTQGLEAQKVGRNELTTLLSGKCEVVIGEYVGNGVNPREIVLGFHPKAVYSHVCQSVYNNISYTLGGLFTRNQPLMDYGGTNIAAEVTSNGFRVTGYGVAMNDAGARQCYFAFR